MRSLFHLIPPCTTIPVRSGMTPPASYARAPPAPRRQSCLAPPSAPVAPHHPSTAPLLPVAIEPRARAPAIPAEPRLHPISRIAPPRASIRVSLSRFGGPGVLAGKNRAVCIPFSPNARKRPPPWQYLHEMHASRDQNGKILALCIHFRVQSGDSGYMARESCHQGPLFASRARKSCMMRRCCQRCPTFRGTAARVAGPRTGRTGFVPCGPGLVRLPYRGSLPSRPRAPRLHACQAAATRRATHRRHSHACAAPQRCRYSRGRIHRRRPSRRARRSHYAASPATSPVTSFITVGGR